MFVMLSDGFDGVVEIEKEDVKKFGVKESTESSYALVVRNLFVFWRLSIPLSK